jgi:ankyrin repeat protein
MKTTKYTQKVPPPYSPDNPEIKKMEGESPNKAKLLKAAAQGCNINIISLVSKGVNIHTPDHNGPDAPLRYACANGHPTTVLLLLAKGANPTIKGGLALKLAVMSKSIKTLEILLSYGIKCPISPEVPLEYNTLSTSYEMSRAIINYIDATR